MGGTRQSVCTRRRRRGRQRGERTTLVRSSRRLARIILLPSNAIDRERRAARISRVSHDLSADTIRRAPLRFVHALLFPFRSPFPPVIALPILRHRISSIIAQRCPPNIVPFPACALPSWTLLFRSGASGGREVSQERTKGTPWRRWSEVRGGRTGAQVHACGGRRATSSRQHE